MIPATTCKFVFDSYKQDDATQSTLQESDVSFMDLADDDHQQEHHHCREESHETTSVSHKTTERLLEPWKETSVFDCLSCIELSDFSILSNLSMDTALENESPPASHDSDLGLGDEFVELLLSLGNKEQENAVYYMAVILLISKYSTILDMVLAAVIVIYIHREKSPALDGFLCRLEQEVYDTILNAIPVIHILPRDNQSPFQQSTILEKRLVELAAENHELKSQLESEKWQVRSLQQSLSRKETILESEVVNRTTFEQSSELLRAIHDHEKTQLTETVKRLEDEIASNKQTMELMERQAIQRDQLLAKILHNFERSQASLSRRASRRRSERGASIANHTLHETDLMGNCLVVTATEV